jgi:hypothetical protein
MYMGGPVARPWGFKRRQQNLTKQTQIIQPLLNWAIFSTPNDESTPPKKRNEPNVDQASLLDFKYENTKRTQNGNNNHEITKQSQISVFSIEIRGLQKIERPVPTEGGKRRTAVPILFSGKDRGLFGTPG